MIIYDPIITGSFQINGSTISSVGQIDSISGSVDSLTQASSSFSSRVSLVESSVNSLNSASSSYLQNTTDTLTGDLTVTGKITAQEFHTEFVSASIIYESGSTQFGNSADDTHIFSGSISVSNGILGTLSTAAQPNITSVGTLSSLTVSGNLTVDTNTLYVDAANNKVGVRTSSPAGAIGIGDQSTMVSTQGLTLGSAGESIIEMIASPFGNGFGAKIQTADPGDGFTYLRIYGRANTSVWTEHISINNTNGNVGIGTSSPSEDLQVSSATDTIIAVETTGTGAGANAGIKILSVDGGDFLWQTGNVTGNALRLFDLNASAERMRIDSAGNVGIGTSSPAVKLHIVGGGEPLRIESTNGTGGNYVQYKNASGDLGYIGWGSSGNDQLTIFQGKNDDIAIFTNSAERMRIDSSGNVGIGTSSPSFKLDVTGASNVDSTARFSKTSEGSLLLGGNRSTSNCPFIGSENAFDFAIITNNTERMRITSGGYVTKPYQPSFRAGRSSNYNPGVNTDIVFNSVSFNTGGHYNATTGVFTAPVAGIYYFSTSVIWMSLTDGQAMDDGFTIRVNGGITAYDFRRAEYVAGTTGNAGYYSSDSNIIVSLAANDAVSVRNYRDLTVHGNTNFCWFVGYLLG